MKTLGRTPLLASRLGLGCATFGREISESVAFELMDYALENGITLFDTAEAYGGGNAQLQRRTQLGLDDVREVSNEMHSSEKIIGRWLQTRRCRDQITLVTKVSRGFRREQVRAALQASLTRLQTDHVDLYLYHSFDPGTPLDESAMAMDAVIRSGLTRAGGVSNHSREQFHAACAACDRQGVARFDTIELPYNLLQADGVAIADAHRNGVRVLAYSPLAAGFLSGKYTPDPAQVPKGTRFDVSPAHVDVYFKPQNFRRVALLQEFAGRVGWPAPQLALAWVLQNPRISTMIVGARNRAHLANALIAAATVFPRAWAEEIRTWLRPNDPAVKKRRPAGGRTSQKRGA